MPLTSEDTNLSLVCDENLGSGIFTEMIAVIPSRVSSPVISILSLGLFFKIIELSVLVSDVLKPDRCVPPSFCGILFVKHKTSS